MPNRSRIVTHYSREIGHYRIRVISDERETSFEYSIHTPDWCFHSNAEYIHHSIAAREARELIVVIMRGKTTISAVADRN